MTDPRQNLVSSFSHPEGFPPLLETLRGLISGARQQVVRSANTIQVQTYWQIGRHIVEFEQGGEARAAYGKRLLADLADALTQEFGQGFDERNLRNMRAFFQHFPIRNALRSELSWTHYRLKTGHLEHQDIGQMDMYVRLYDDLRRGEGDNPTVGILLCGSKDHSVVRYSVLNDSEQLFASKYRLVLPSEDVLRRELERDREELEARRELETEKK